MRLYTDVNGGYFNLADVSEFKVYQSGSQFAVLAVVPGVSPGRYLKLFDDEPSAQAALDRLARTLGTIEVV